MDELSELKEIVEALETLERHAITVSGMCSRGHIQMQPGLFTDKQCPNNMSCVSCYAKRLQDEYNEQSTNSE